jgi:hypothetical protein
MRLKLRISLAGTLETGCSPRTRRGWTDPFGDLERLGDIFAISQLDGWHGHLLVARLLGEIMSDLIERQRLRSDRNPKQSGASATSVDCTVDNGDTCARSNFVAQTNGENALPPSGWVTSSYSVNPESSEAAMSNLEVLAEKVW